MNFSTCVYIAVLADHSVKNKTVWISGPCKRTEAVTEHGGES